MAHIVIDARIISTTTGRYVERLLHHLELIDTTHRYTVLTKKKDLTYWQPTNPNFTILEADFKNYSFEEQIGFLKLLNSLQADLVHFCMPEQPVLYQGKKVTTIHDLTLLKTYNPDKNWFVYKSKQLIGQFVFRRVVKTSDYIFAPTEFTKKELLQRFHPNNPDKIARIPLAAELKTTKAQPFKLPSKNFILFVGQQSRYKNIRTLQEAHIELLRRYPDLLLVLAGKIDGPAKENQTYFESIGAKNVIFTGFIEDEQLSWLYKNTKAYVFPSYMEGFGLPGLEAMIYGAPVASSNATCLPEVYGDAALYFNPDSATEMAETISKLIADEKFRKVQVMNGFKKVKEYSWERTARETYNHYQKALGNN